MLQDEFRESDADIHHQDTTRGRHIYDRSEIEHNLNMN